MKIATSLLILLFGKAESYITGLNAFIKRYILISSIVARLHRESIVEQVIYTFLWIHFTGRKIGWVKLPTDKGSSLSKVGIKFLFWSTIYFAFLGDPPSACPMRFTIVTMVSIRMLFFSSRYNSISWRKSFETLLIWIISNPISDFSHNLTTFSKTKTQWWRSFSPN